ncbi:UbiA prenyltransferase family [Suillus lakei]|nr:UbiA prenyltransferase family [Suillus lakei]
MWHTCLLIITASCLAWGLLSAAYFVALSMNEVAKNILFYALLSTSIHCAGCVIDVIFDRDFDWKVERSKGRPIVLGTITMTEASILLAVLVAVICYIFTLGVVGLPACGGTYPLMKRWTYWPSLFLGFAASWGVPFTWVATTGQFKWGMILNVAIASCCTSYIYDAIYACQDKDDEKAGVKSTAVRLGEGIRPPSSVFGVTFFACLLRAGYLNGQRLPFYLMGDVAPFLW